MLLLMRATLVGREKQSGLRDTFVFVVINILQSMSVISVNNILGVNISNPSEYVSYTGVGGTLLRWIRMSREFNISASMQPRKHIHPVMEVLSVIRAQMVGRSVFIFWPSKHLLSASLRS